MFQREILPDPIYGSRSPVTKLVNSIMLDGKKGVAQEGRLVRSDREEKTGKQVWS